jgi:ribosomal protein S12 methylthiotransferase accessory factor
MLKKKKPPEPVGDGIAAFFDPPIEYTLTLVKTAAAAGYFECVPKDEISFDNALAYLKAHPNDEFMHRFLLDRILEKSPESLALFAKAASEKDPVSLSLYREAARRQSKPEGPGTRDPIPSEVAAATPLITLRSDRLANQPLHREYVRRFRENLLAHRPLPPPGGLGLPPLYPDILREKPAAPSVPLEKVAAGDDPVDTEPETPPLSPEETAGRALDRLEAAGILAGVEMRHIASLSPVALLRKWRVEISVQCDGFDYRVAGLQTGYGRGFSLETARVRYAMEIVERCASFSSVAKDRLVGTHRQHRLVRGAYTALREKDPPPLDPDRLALEVPYENAPLYWIEGVRIEDGREVPVRVPFQSVFLFSNLDEPCLYSGLGSTGLGAGSTVAEARRSALLEIIERDCEATVFYSPSQCFRLEADDPYIGALLADYRRRGVSVQFLDLTGEMGIPCYKCFVIDPDGRVVKGTGAHLDGRYALISAMTETPYPYPQGPPSGPGPDGLPRVRFESLPNHSTGRADRDLKRLESVLAANGYAPIYVDLTRSDIRLPVVRAIVPGLEIMADFDDCSRVGRRLYRNYLRHFGE